MCLFTASLQTVLCGGLGGTALWLAVFPADLIKSRVQVHSGPTATTQGFWSMLYYILRLEGKSYTVINTPPSPLYYIYAPPSPLLGQNEIHYVMASHTCPASTFL
jgi:hypothetical protein